MRYRKKPVEIEAVQMPLQQDQPAVRKVAEWMADHGYRPTEWAEPGDVDEDFAYGDLILPEYASNALFVDTLEGTMRARLGDWIICGVQGEFYPCDPDIFEATYEPVDGPEQP